MPATSVHHHPQGFDIVFDEASHSYTTTFTAPPTRECPREARHTVKYTSGTTFIHKFCAPFDPDGRIAERKARERGVSPDQIRFEWKQKGVEACEMGTRVHETCEDILHGRAFRNKPLTPHEKALMSSGWRACQFILKNYDIVGIEQMIGDIEVEIAGTMDLLVRRKETGRFCIMDWKTNGKIDFKNSYGHKMLHDVAHLDDCSAVHYGLQLNLYEYVMKKAGYVPRDTPFDKVIIHLADDGPHPYQLPDYQVEVRDMVIRSLVTPPF